MNPTLAVKRSPNSPRVRRRAAPAILVAALLLVGPALITPSGATQPPVSLFPSTAGSTITVGERHGGGGGWCSLPDERRRHRHRVAVLQAGAARWRRSRGTCGPRPAALLASVNFTGETASGWQTANLAQPVALAKDTTYTVSYFAPKGGYAATLDYFRGRTVVSGPLTAPAQGNGVYRYGSAPSYPNTTYSRSPNYWADIVFTPGTTDDADRRPRRRRRRRPGRRRRRPSRR